MADIVVKRGLKSNVGSLVLKVGELALATDTGELYAGTTTGVVLLNPKGGQADQAAKLSTARAFSISGDATAPVINFDGTANVQLNLTLAAIGGLTAGTYTKLTVNSKGQVTSGGQVQVTDIDGIGSAASKNTGKSAGNVVILESDGKIDPDLIPAMAITDVHEAETEAAMLALGNAGPGDICVRSDVNRTYILKQLPVSTLSNWIELKTPTDVVLSVNGKTGVVALSKSDIGLGNVDNTADNAKTVSKANQLTTPRNIALSGGVTGAATPFDGTSNITIPISSVDASALSGTIDGGTF